MAFGRKTRYAAAVSTLLALVFTGVGAVIGILGRTTFRPLPFSRPETLVYLTEGGNLFDTDTLAATVRLAPEVAGFATFAASTPSLAVVHAGVTQPAVVVQTSANFFDLLQLSGVRANLRDYREQRGTAIISTTLARDLQIAEPIGASIRLGDRAFTVAGVVDPIDAFPVGADVWYAERAPGPVWLGLIRTKAPADLDALVSRLDFAVRTVTGDQRQMVSARAIGDVFRPTMSAEQRALAAGIVLFAIIALLNFGLLGIGEAHRREQEFAVRVALGAGRARVAREFIWRQLALIGVAVAAAIVLLAAARVLLPWDMSVPIAGLPTLIWELLILFLCALLGAAVVPSRIASGAGEMEVLRRVGARGSRFEQAWNRGFIGLQFGVTAFLIVAGGTAALTLRELQRTAYGFVTDRVVIGTLNFRTPALQSDEASAAAVLDLDARVAAASPGNATMYVLSGRTMRGGPYHFATDPPTEGPTTLTAWSAPPWVSEDVDTTFFDVMGIRIVAGRGFRSSDDRGSQPVVIMSEMTARRFGGTQQALGKRVRFGQNDGDWRVVVGVASDAYPIEAASFEWQAIGRTGRRWPTNLVYRPLRQALQYNALNVTSNSIKDGNRLSGTFGFGVLVRSTAPTATTLPSILERAAPGEKFGELKPLSDYLDSRGEVERGRFTMKLLAQFALVGFALALVGALLLVDEVVRSRTNEIGIRRALGAPSAHLVALASRETFFAGATGVAFGTLVGARFGPVVAAWMKAAAMERFLPHPQAGWPLITMSALLLLLLIAGGTALRALRAARLDPMVALRTL